MQKRSLTGPALDDFIRSRLNSPKSVAELAKTAGVDPDDYLERYMVIASQPPLQSSRETERVKAISERMKQRNKDRGRPRVYVSREEYEDMRHMYESGCPLRRICQKYHLTNLTVHRILDAPEKYISPGGLSRLSHVRMKAELDDVIERHVWNIQRLGNYGYTVFGREDYELLKALRNSGRTISEIAVITGCTAKTIADVFLDPAHRVYGYSESPAGERQGSAERNDTKG